MELARTSFDGPSAWPKTVFDTEEWHSAWSRSTIEEIAVAARSPAGMYAVNWSPFWQGYAFDAGMAPIWDAPVLTVGSLYSFYGPAYLLGSTDEVEATVDRALAYARDCGTAGCLIANLPADAALAWAAIRPPTAAVRLDIAYHREVGLGADGITGMVEKRVRVDWRRRWRRATERGLRLVAEADPDPARIAEVIDLANGSAVRHSWPAVYDQTTAEAVLTVPGTRLLRADWDGQTVAGFIALEFDRTLYLWAGGTHETLLREVSPYLFLLYELLANGAERGLDRIEFGRGNDAFKRKYGFTGTDTWSLWYAGTPGDADRFGPVLVELNDRLSDAMGVQRKTLPLPIAGFPVADMAGRRL